MEAKFPVRAPGLGAMRDFFSLIKIGVVASNCLTAMAGLALAAAEARLPLNGFAVQRGLPVAFGVASLVAGSCALNNWIDRDIDAKMERTRSRPTVSGSFKPSFVVFLGFGLCALGLATLAATTMTALLVALGGAFAYLAPYSLWSKRRSSMSLLIGGISGAAPPLIGWAAIDPALAPRAWILFAFLVLWQQPHVRALALMLAEEYRAARIPMAGLGKRGAAAAPNGDSRAKFSLIAWLSALLPFPFLLGAGDAHDMRVAILGLGVSLAWLVTAIATASRRPVASWGRLMFRCSLGYLMAMSAILVAATLTLR